VTVGPFFMDGARAIGRALVSQCGWQICRDLSTVPRIIIIATHRTRLFLPGVAIMILLEIHNRILEETLTNKIKHVLSGWGPRVRARFPSFSPPVGDPLGPVLSPRITSFREMWRRGGVPRRYLPSLVTEQFVEPRPPSLRVALLFNHVSSRLVPLLSFQVPSQDVTFFSFN